MYRGEYREGIWNHENRSWQSSRASVWPHGSSDENRRVFTEKYNFQDISGHLMFDDDTQHDNLESPLESCQQQQETLSRSSQG